MSMAYQTPTEALNAAIAAYPTLRAFAAEMGVSYQVVQQWQRNGVPVDKCAAVEFVSKGIATRKDLRPNDWQQIWPELADAPQHRANKK